MRLANGTDGVYGGALSGYLTIDVVNYCTNYFPDQPQLLQQGRHRDGRAGRRRYTPNVLIGDVFYIDTAAQRRQHLAATRPFALEFDSRLADLRRVNDRQDLLRQVRRGDEPPCSAG